MKRFIFCLLYILLIPTCVFAQNGLINPEQIAKTELSLHTAGESFQDQELAYLDTASNTIKKLITGVYKSYEVSIKASQPQIRTTACGTNEIIVVTSTYSSPNQTLNIYYINNNNPENPIIINSGTVSFATGTAQTYYDCIYVGDNTIYFFYMRSTPAYYCVPITNIKTENGATLGTEVYLFANTSGYITTAYYDPTNDKILVPMFSVNTYCVISSPKTSPTVSTFAASYPAYHTGGHVLGIGNNKALFFYTYTNRIFAECVTNLDTTPATTSERTYTTLYNHLTEVWNKSAYTVYLGNNKGAVFVTEEVSPFKVWSVPFSIVNDSVVFGSPVLVCEGTDGSTMQWVSASAIGSDVMVALMTDSSSKLMVVYVYYENNQLYTSSYGINIYSPSITLQCFTLYMGNNSLAVIVRGESIELILLNNIMPYYNTNPSNIDKYIVMGYYKTDEVALCKTIPKKSYSDNYSFYNNDVLNKPLFIGPLNKYTPYRTIIPVSANINNIGNTYLPIMPPDDSAFGNKYVLDTIGTILQKNLQNIKGF